MSPILTIAGRALSPSEPAWIIAEAGVNHDGDVDRAVELIAAAARAGADAVKFQCFVADRLARPGAALSDYQRRAGTPATDQREMLGRLELPRKCFPRLLDEARKQGIVCFASPFDDDSLRFLMDLGVPALKLGSGELTNTPLLRQAAAAGVPVLLSTGMASRDEIDTALETLRGAGAPHPVLLHCVTAYPTPIQDANILAVRTMREWTGCLVGYSDHTEGLEASLAARSLGACVLERHLTHDRTALGPDHAASLDPQQFAAWVAAVRRLEAALGDGIKRHRAGEAENRSKVRKAIVARDDIPAGTRLEPCHLDTRRPAQGLGAERWDELMGARTVRSIPAGEAVLAEDLERPATTPSMKNKETEVTR